MWQWAMRGATVGNEACLGRAQQGEAAASQTSHTLALQQAQGVPTHIRGRGVSQFPCFLPRKGCPRQPFHTLPTTFGCFNAF